MTNNGPPNGEERREHLELNPEDRDCLVRIEVHCETTSTWIKDHEKRLRKVEIRQTGITVSQGGLWTLILAVGGWLGLR